VSRKSPSDFLKHIFSSLSLLNRAIKLIIIINSLFLLFFSSCSPTKRFTENEEKTNNTETELTKNETPSVEVTEMNVDYSAIRVSMQGVLKSDIIILDSDVILSNENRKLATLQSGGYINCYYKSGEVGIVTDEGEFNAKKFSLAPTNQTEVIKINGKRFRGEIQISSSGSSIDLINVLNLEDYVKGVLPKEMPIGKGKENLEALKALAICVRTYAIQKINDGKIYFDIYADTRDQVYGGVDAEQTISNNAVDETKNLILKYDDNTATIFYHSTCGGYTESSQNVFAKSQIPYLISIKDGNGPNCNISPRYEWEEIYSRESIIIRLKDYNLLDNKNYSLEDINISSRYNSGRVNELEIVITDDFDKESIVTIRGNEIRSILRTANNKSILWSTLFDIQLDSDKIIISGKGFGHGVGLCQWGAISLSKNGRSYSEILELYYPGTEIGAVND